MPAIDLAAIRKHIASRQLSPVYLLTGEDTRLLDRLVDDIEATVDEGDRPFAVEHVYAGEPGGSPVDIASASRVFPMLGDRRIVIVLRAERLLKPKRAARAADIVEAEEEEAEAAIDLAALEEYVANPVPSTTVVFVAAEIDRTRRFTKQLVQRADVVVCGGIGAEDPSGAWQAKAAALRLIRDQFADSGRTIDQAAAELLVERAGGDIDKLRGDLERLRLYTEGRTKITRDDVFEVAAVSLEVEDDWAVVNAIADGDVARAVRQVGRRMDRGDSPHMLVGQLRWWVSSRLAPADPGRVRGALDALLRTDIALKSSGGDGRVLIERLVVDLTGRPIGQPGGWSRR
jgi:DNA polymerase-3 subunit delta